MTAAVVPLKHPGHDLFLMHDVVCRLAAASTYGAKATAGKFASMQGRDYRTVAHAYISKH